MYCSLPPALLSLLMTQMPSQFSKNELNNESHVWIVNLGKDAGMGVESNCSGNSGLTGHCSFYGGDAALDKKP